MTIKGAVTGGILIFLCVSCYGQSQANSSMVTPETLSIDNHNVLGFLQRFGILHPGVKANVVPLVELSPLQRENISNFVQSITASLNTNPLSLKDVLHSLSSLDLFDKKEYAANFGNTTVDGGQTHVDDTANLTYLPGWQQCHDDIGLIIEGINKTESWALQMLDASAKPGNSIMRGNLKFMGNYKECQDVSHPVGDGRQLEGNICRLFISLPFQIVPPMLVPTQPPVEWDVCLPKSCWDYDLSLAFVKYSLPMKTVCTKDLDVTSDTKAIAAITILTLFGVLLVAGTIVDIIISQRKPKHKYVVNGYSNEALDSSHDTSFDVEGKDKVDGVNIESTPTNDLPIHADRYIKNCPAKASQPRWQQALLAFSVPRNTEKILSVKSTPGAIGCLHGIRVLSLAWVILGHVMYFGIVMANIDNPLYVVTKIVPKVAFEIIPSAYLAVDTFFLLSGFLTCYMFLKKLGEKGRITIKEFVLYYVHRYWRLTPSLMMWIMVVACLLTYIGAGRPAWRYYPTSCQDNWWNNMLYINNVHQQPDACVGVTWYLACDFQFYIIAPLALIPWLYGQKIIGFVMAAVFLSVHLATTLALEIKYNADNFVNTRDYNNYIYFKPYTRVGPYAIGLMLGWVLWKTNCKVKMNKYLVFLGWIICFAVILFLTLVRHSDHKDFPHFSWSKAARVSYQTLFRPVWALAVSWVVFACATGHGGYVNSILSWDGWLPLSRLSYSAYLVHLTIIIFEALIPEYTYLLTTTSLFYTFIKYFVMAYAVGYLLTVTVESPALGLEKAILG